MFSVFLRVLKDAYTQSRKLYENRICSWYGALQQIVNNIPKLKQLSTNQKVSKQTIKKILLEAYRFGALKSDSTHHFFRNACTKSGSLWFSQFSGC